MDLPQQTGQAQRRTDDEENEEGLERWGHGRRVAEKIERVLGGELLDLGLLG